jgi:hypothetical protein
MAQDRLYIVTFDIEGSAGREGDYGKVEKALQTAFGPKNYRKIVKQCCVIRTVGPGAVPIRDAIKLTLGKKCNIVVLRLARGYAIKICDALLRAQAGKLFKELPKKKSRR